MRATGAKSTGCRPRVGSDSRRSPARERYHRASVRARRGFGGASEAVSVRGWVAERLKAPVLKTGNGATRSWVRIPPHPPTPLRQRPCVSASPGHRRRAGEERRTRDAARRGDRGRAPPISAASTACTMHAIRFPARQSDPGGYHERSCGKESNACCASACVTRRAGFPRQCDRGFQPRRQRRAATRAFDRLQHRRPPSPVPRPRRPSARTSVASRPPTPEHRRSPRSSVSPNPAEPRSARSPPRSMPQSQTFAPLSIPDSVTAASTAATRAATELAPGAVGEATARLRSAARCVR